MVGFGSLLLPIFLSAVLVFFASFLFHMVLPFHRSDFSKVPDEDAAQDALRKLGIPPGDYMIPCAGSPEGMKKPEFKERMQKGPVVVMTVFRPGSANLGGSLFQWFLYLLLVGFLAAYITGRALGPGAPYLVVFRFAGATSFIAYSIGLWQNSIWYKQKWSTTLKNTVDGFVYGLLTAGAFGWLWPKG
jgi:hypothetical protein